jgi:hypothetical protein
MRKKKWRQVAFAFTKATRNRRQQYFVLILAGRVRSADPADCAERYVMGRDLLRSIGRDGEAVDYRPRNVLEVPARLL